MHGRHRLRLAAVLVAIAARESLVPGTAHGAPAHMSGCVTKLRAAVQSKVKLAVGCVNTCATLTPTLSLAEGEGVVSIPSVPKGERDRVRGRIGRGTRARD